MMSSVHGRSTARRIWLLAGAVATLASAACPQGPVDPMRQALARLSELGSFRLAFDGAFEQEGVRLTDIHVEGVFADATTYQIDATFRVMDKTSVHRVVRIGDRQWEWVEAEAGWRATLPGGDVVSQSVAGLVTSLATARDVTEGEVQAIGGAECQGYRFVIPAGAATIQGLPVEGSGTLWVRLADGLPVQLDLTVSTPIGSIGLATVALSDHGAPTEILPPGLGGAAGDGGPPLRGSALGAAMEGREVIHWTLEASGEGEAVVASILPAGGVATVLDVYILPGRPGAVARLRAGDKLLGEMIVDGDVMCEYFASPDADAEPQWSCRAIDPNDPQAPWRLHTQIVEQSLGDRPLIPEAAPVGGGEDGARWYWFDPAEGGPSGLFLPLVKDELVAGDAEMTGRVMLGAPFGELRQIELAIHGRTEAGERLAAMERYRFAYEISDQERADLEAAFAQARGRAEARHRGHTERAQELAGLVEQVARESAWAFDDPDALRVKLGRLERAPGVLAAWVLGPDGGVLAAAGPDAAHPPAVVALGEFGPGSPTSARAIGDGDPSLMAAPVVSREGALQGYVVARWTAR